jgi:alanine racemase
LDNVWVRVYADVLQENMRAVASFLGSEVKSGPKIMAVVKANGYGHGAGVAALAFRAGGAGRFGVTTLVEALDLIDAGIDSRQTPVLIFSPAITKRQCEIAIKLGLHVTVCDEYHVDLLGSIANELGKTVQVHLKIDTGMGRLGLAPNDAYRIATSAKFTGKLHLAGVYTHFATAYQDSLAATQRQLQTFMSFTDSLNAAGISGFLRHCANSAALLRLPNSRLDMVRAGTVLYGQYPTQHSPRVPGLNGNTLALQARAIFVHDIPAGATVGYGSEYKVTRQTVAAVLPVGFADGVTMQPASLSMGLRGLKSAAASILRPQSLLVSFGSLQAPVIGRVSTQMIVVDVTDLRGAVKTGDIATIPARRLAIGARLPRVVSVSKATQ